MKKPSEDGFFVSVVFFNSDGNIADDSFYSPCLIRISNS